MLSGRTSLDAWPPPHAAEAPTGFVVVEHHAAGRPTGGGLVVRSLPLCRVDYAGAVPVSRPYKRRADAMRRALSLTLGRTGGAS